MRQCILRQLAFFCESQRCFKRFSGFSGIPARCKNEFLVQVRQFIVQPNCKPVVVNFMRDGLHKHGHDTHLASLAITLQQDRIPINDFRHYAALLKFRSKGAVLPR